MTMKLREPSFGTLAELRPQALGQGDRFGAAGEDGEVVIKAR